MRQRFRPASSPILAPRIHAAARIIGMGQRKDYPQGHLFGAWAKPDWKPRRGNFAALTREELASQCRAILIDRLDKVLANARLEIETVMEADYRDNGELTESAWFKIIQLVQLAFFPEEFLPYSTLETGFIPRSGIIERVGEDRFDAWAGEFLESIEEFDGPAVTIGGVRVPAGEADVLAKRSR